MKINILSIGRFGHQDPYRQLFEEYHKRTTFAPIKLQELWAKGSVATPEQEEKLLLQHLAPQGKLMVLDERGQNLSTPELATLINRYEMEAVANLDIVIGGAEGLTEKLRQKADVVVSLSRMVFPHLMVRVILMEQLYRVHTLKHHHPYHK